VETAVIEEAVDVIDCQKPRILVYGVSNEQAWEVGLACGGQIQVYVDPLIAD
jgi:xanthine/CO dehydrogenase XdhC/CoxF family maturation factor